jgi:hypothetical protein
MMNPQTPTVWQMMAAFASDEYELREVAPGEYEIVPAASTNSDTEQADGAVSRPEEPVRAEEPVSAYER